MMFHIDITFEVKNRDLKDKNDKLRENMLELFIIYVKII